MWCLLCGPATAAEKLREFSWSQMKAADRVRAGRVLSAGPDGAEESLQLENAAPAPMTAQILVIDQPGVTLPVYALHGRLRCQDVEGIGYLEMWNHFPDGSAYFSRTMAQIGPMAGFSGTTGWRPVALPFSAAGTAKRPSKLVINVVLPGKGKVWIGSLKLVQYAENENPLTAAAAWWTDRQAGIWGGVAGSALGLWGAVVGILCSAGRARSFVLAAMAVLTTLGGAAVAIGIAAVLLRQPWGVYYPLLLGGGLAVALFGSMLRIVGRRYAEIELRRMAAMDGV